MVKASAGISDDGKPVESSDSKLSLAGHDLEGISVAGLVSQLKQLSKFSSDSLQQTQESLQAA